MSTIDFFEEVIKRRQNGWTWVDLAKEFGKHFGENLTDDALRHRVDGYVKRKERYPSEPEKWEGVSVPFRKESRNIGSESETLLNGNKVVLKNTFAMNQDGTIDEDCIINSRDINYRNSNDLLRMLGYSPEEWELVTYRVCQWEGTGKDNKTYNSIKYKVRPKPKTLTEDELRDGIRELMLKEVKPLILPTREDFTRDENCRLMEVAPIELHLGKIADEVDTGNVYNVQIARQIFVDIINEIIKKQEIEHCDKCLLVIGSDFFNSESDNCTTTHKILQQNEHRYLDIFLTGLKMYTGALMTLREYFETIDVMLCAGNHAKAMETYLYIALQQRFLNDKCIHFIENYRETQAYTFGNCAIFFNHGDAKLPQLTASIPAEFPEVWGSHNFRELHMGHLHKEMTVDDNGGMITRRVGSPCGTDAWHYTNRFIGAVKKHEIFIWDYDSGLKEIYYINNYMSSKLCKDDSSLG